MNCFVDNLTIWHFNYICDNYEVRCLRNNIYETVKVNDFKHLVELWRNHPRCFNENDYNQNPNKLLFSIRYIFREIERRGIIGRFNTNAYLFTIYIGKTEKQIINELRGRHKKK